MHSSRSRTPVALLAIAGMLFSVAVPAAARADGGTADAASAGVGVARISVIQGAVAVQRGDSATPVAAAINAPVLGADYVTTGDGARSEIQFDGSSSVRLGAGVQMRFTHLDTAARELQLAAGTIDLRLLRGTDGRSQIDTPSISVRPRAAGSYRVSVDSAGATQVTVRAGSADIVTAQGTQSLGTGTTLLAQGAASNPWIQRIDAIAYDDFDRFNRERDDRENRGLADDYAAPGVAGIDDLDAYGRWVTDGGYGNVWVPYNAASSWAPYRDGRWVWEEGFGWTWLGYEPWGWAPYHYGRWYHSPRYGWCWYPERAFVTWRPAVVAFVGFGSFGFGFGDIGWVPLAPYETYYPWWGNGYGNNVTYVTNNYYYIDKGHHGHHDNDAVVNKSNALINARYNGVTYVSHQNFVAGNFDHPRAVDPSKVRTVHPIRGLVPAVPTDANLRFSNHPVAAHLAVAPALLGGTFAGNDIAVRRTPFVQQRDALANVVHVRAPLPKQSAAVQQSSVQQPAVQQAAQPRIAPRIPVTDGTTTTQVPVNATDPWARFGASRGTPVTHSAASAGAAAVGKPQEPDAWRHFDATRPATMREAPTARNVNVTRDVPPRANGAPPQTREYNAAHPVQQSAPQSPAVQQHAAPAPPPPAVQQRSAPPPAARTEHPPAAAKTTNGRPG